MKQEAGVGKKDLAIRVPSQFLEPESHRLRAVVQLLSGNCDILLRSNWKLDGSDYGDRTSGFVHQR